MQRRYPFTLKIVFVFIFSLLALFVPYYPLKIVFGIVAIVLLGLNFRRFGVLFIVLAIIFIVLPSGITGIMKSNFFFFPFSFMRGAIPYYGHKYGFSTSNNGSQKLYPDKFVESARNIVLNVNERLEIVFDPESTEVRIPSELNVERFDEKVEISSFQNAFDNKTYVVNIGTKVGHDNIHIKSDGLVLKGKVAKKIGFLSVNCDGICLSGSLKLDTFKLNCDGASLDGEIDAKNVEINADGMSAHLSLKNVQNFNANCDGVTGSVMYEDTWSGIRLFSMKADGGYLTVRVPKTAGVLNVEARDITTNVVKY